MEKQYINEQTAKTKDKKGKLLVLRVLAPILFGLTTAFLVYTFVDILIDPGSNQGLSFALWFALIFVIFGSGGYIASIIPPLIGVIITLVKRPQGLRVGQLIYFIIFTALPILFWVLIFVLAPPFINGLSN